MQSPEKYPAQTSWRSNSAALDGAPRKIRDTRFLKDYVWFRNTNPKSFGTYCHATVSGFRGGIRWGLNRGYPHIRA